MADGATAARRTVIGIGIYGGPSFYLKRVEIKGRK